MNYFSEMALAIGLTVLIVLVVILPIEYVYERRHQRKSAIGDAYRTVVAVFDRRLSELTRAPQFAGAMAGESIGIPYKWDLEALSRLSWLQLGWLEDQIFFMQRRERGSHVLIVRANVRQDAP